MNKKAKIPKRVTGSANRRICYLRPPTPIIEKAKFKNKLVWGFTLMEVLIVIIIIAILAALAIPTYTRSVQRARDSEAFVNLGLIRTGEKIYRLDYGVYFPSAGNVSDIGQINSYLNIDIPAPEDKWDYSVTGGASFEAHARRLNTPSGSADWGIGPSGNVYQLP
jgi:prepilin-type N-terminal cleavage/methylation domain-containing protein